MRETALEIVIERRERERDIVCVCERERERAAHKDGGFVADEPLEEAVHELEHRLEAAGKEQEQGRNARGWREQRDYDDVGWNAASPKQKQDTESKNPHATAS